MKSWKLNGILSAIFLFLSAGFAYAEGVPSQTTTHHLSIEVYEGGSIRQQMIKAFIDSRLNGPPGFSRSRFSGNTQDYPFSDQKFGIHNFHLSGIFYKRILNVLDTFLARKRIFLFSEFSPGDLSSASYNLTINCDQEARCKNIKGFFLPTSNSIFLRKDLSDKEFLSSLFHELVHAFQYNYRLPLDLISSRELIEDKKMAAKDAATFLNYYYESQAHYYRIRLSYPENWRASIEEKTRKMGVKAWLGLSALVPVVSFVSSIALQQWNRAYSRYLPNIDRFRYVGNEVDPPLEGAAASLDLNELATQMRTSVPLMGQWNARFHWHFSRSVEYAYFGSMGAVFRRDMPNHEGFNKLHDSYYKFIGTNESLESEPVCRELFGDSLKSQDPFQFWSKVTTVQFSQCTAFQHLSTTLQKLGAESIAELSQQQNDSQAQDILADSKFGSDRIAPANEKVRSSGELVDLGRYLSGLERRSQLEKLSPFVGLKKLSEKDETPDSIRNLKGGEGTTPDLDVDPILPVLPDFEVLPIQLPEQ